MWANAELQAPLRLLPVPTEDKAEWAHEHIWTFCERGISLLPLLGFETLIVQPGERSRYTYNAHLAHHARKKEQKYFSVPSSPISGKAFLFWTVPTLRSAVLTTKSNMWIEHCWENTDRGKPKYSEKTP
jgi:hypothetical protein